MLFLFNKKIVIFFYIKIKSPYLLLLVIYVFNIILIYFTTQMNLKKQFLYACRDGDFEKVQTLLKNNPNIKITLFFNL